MNPRLAQIEKTTLSEFRFYRPADRRVDDRAGARDGKSDRPATNDDRHPFRERIITAATASLGKHHHRVENYENELAKREGDLQQELDERYAEKRDQLHAEYSDRIAQIEQIIGPHSGRHSMLRDGYQRALDRERQIEADVGRPLRIHLRYWYALIMAFVALVEIPINRFAFELYFAETPALSLLIALGIGFTLMLLAHFAGTWLKRSFGAKTLGQKITYGVGVALAALLVFPTIYLIALLRQHYVQFVEAQNMTFEELLGQRGVEGVAREVITTDLGTSGFMLLMINVLVIGIAVIVAVARHDSHPDYENAVHIRKRSEKRYRRLQERNDKAIAKATATRDSLLGALDKQRERLEGELDQVRADQKACAAHRDQMLQQVVLHLCQRLQAYEQGNELVRENAPPECFGHHDERTVKKRVLDALAISSDDSTTSDRGIRAVR